MCDKAFDNLADRYDRWFDSPEGVIIFDMEAACVRDLMTGRGDGWLEVGVGTGRFAEALGITEGLDPSLPMLDIAARRSVHVRSGHGEAMPYPDASFDGVVMVVTLCFLSDPAKTFEQCQRVLKRDGCLLVGLVPSDSPWGQLYIRKGRNGHPFYSVATFYTCDQVIRIAADAGFAFDHALSCLLTPPGKPIPPNRPPRQGIVKNAGFVVMRFSKSHSGICGQDQISEDTTN